MARKYIHHHNGTVHSVEADLFYVHLAQARQIKYEDKTVEPAREATPDEVRGYWERQGFVYLAETDEALTPAEAEARIAPEKPERPVAKAAEKAKE